MLDWKVDFSVIDVCVSDKGRHRVQPKARAEGNAQKQNVN